MRGRAIAPRCVAADRRHWLVDDSANSTIFIALPQFSASHSQSNSSPSRDVFENVKRQRFGEICGRSWPRGRFNQNHVPDGLCRHAWAQVQMESAIANYSGTANFFVACEATFWRRGHGA